MQNQRRTPAGDTRSQACEGCHKRVGEDKTGPLRPGPHPLDPPLPSPTRPAGRGGGRSATVRLRGLTPQSLRATFPGMPLQRPAQTRISLPLEEIESLCRKWRIRELSLFGSVLRDDFHPGSDVDVLVNFEPEAHWSLFDFIDLQDELEGLLQRKVDVVSERGLRNPFRRREIQGTRQVVYAA